MQIISNYHRSFVVNPCPYHEFIPVTFYISNWEICKCLPMFSELDGGYEITNVILIDIAFGLGYQI